MEGSLSEGDKGFVTKKNSIKKEDRWKEAIAKAEKEAEEDVKCNRDKEWYKKEDWWRCAMAREEQGELEAAPGDVHSPTHTCLERE